MDDSVRQATVTGLLESTTQKSPTRSCFLLRVRPEMLAEYIEEHQRVWPQMRDALTGAGWRNYSLFCDPATGMVVGYFESDDADAARERMATSAVNAQWQAAMRKYFVQPDGGTDRILPQYFYLP